jgi:hypothetical protein
VRWIALILLIGVFVRHDTSFLLAKFTRLSAPEWFYLLGGWWEAILCMTLATRVRGYFAVAALWIGTLEGGQIALCQSFLQGPVPLGMNECDYLTGLPIGAWIVAGEIVILLGAAGMKWRWGSGLWSS